MPLVKVSLSFQLFLLVGKSLNTAICSMWQDVVQTCFCPLSNVQMTMYIEACESGSLFQNMVENDLNLYITTAANANESSWGTYCPGEVSLESFSLSILCL